MSPHSVVLTCAVMTGAITIGSDFATGVVPDLRLGVGVFGAAVLLSLLSDFAPELGKSVAVLMLVTALLVKGGPLWDALTGITKPKGSK